nr:hypothetical protein [Tanacetum cinerariifolium]
RACLGLVAMILGTAALTGLAAVTDTGLDLVITAAGTICFGGYFLVDEAYCLP